MQIRVLGALDVVDDAGASLRIGAPTQRRLLALLVLHAGAVVSADRIAEVLWGEGQPVHPGNALQGQVSRLRRVLGAGWILTRAPGYLLAASAPVSDAAVFTELVGRARAAAAAEAAELLDQALGLWRGGAYVEFADEEFARAEAARLEELRTNAEEDRADVELALGHAADAVARAEVLVAAHPLRERPHALLMRGLYLAGRHADALEVYRGYRDRLDDELGLTPSAELRGLQDRILRQDLALAPAPTADPAPATGPTPPGELRRPTTALIGRERDLAALAAVLRRARVVTLVGVGGVGKTLLALHAAARIADEHADGAALVELAAVRDPAAVPDAVSTALGVQPRAGLDVPARLLEFLRPKRLLLVLDNCEHVVDAAGRLVEAIGAGCPSVVVLATSREPLGVTGEQLRALAPLEVPSAGITDPAEAATAPALRLLLDRAADAAPEFALEPANLVAVAEICRRLDGLPLAIELAAPRLRAMSAAEVATRLDARFPLLRGGRRSADERQRSLRALIDWSYDLLDEPQRRMFDRLAVFAGPFPLSAAERVCADVADPDRVAVLVLDLVDRSMLVANVARADRASRYALLETMRAYGRDRLAERGETARASRAHAEWAAAFAESAEAGIQGADEARWVDALTAETAELRAAHRWALDHDLELAVRLLAPLFWYAEFRTAEMLDWAERTVEAAERAAFTHPRLPVVYAMAAVAARFRGDLERTAALAGTGTRLAGGGAAGFGPRNILADVAFFEGRLDEAEAQFVDLARDSAAAGERYPHAVALWMRALSRAYRGDRAAALTYAEQAHVEAAGLGNPSMIGWASYTEAETLLDLDPPRALRLLDEASTLARAVGNRYLDGVASISAASVEARHGDPLRALRQFRDVITMWHDAGGWTQLWTAMRSVIDLLSRVGADEDAATLYGAVEASPTATPVFGDDAERLRSALRIGTERLGAEHVAAAVRRGAALGDDGAVNAATAAIDAATTAAQQALSDGPDQ